MLWHCQKLNRKWAVLALLGESVLPPSVWRFFICESYFLAIWDHPRANQSVVGKSVWLLVLSHSSRFHTDYRKQLSSLICEASQDPRMWFVRSNDLNPVRISSWVFLFFLAILDLSFFLVIVFDLQIGKNKTFLAENGNKIGVRLFLFVFVIINIKPHGGEGLHFSLYFFLL